MKAILAIATVVTFILGLSTGLAGTIDMSDELDVAGIHIPSSVSGVGVTENEFVVTGSSGKESLDGSGWAAFGVTFDEFWTPSVPTVLNEQTAESQGNGICRGRTPDGFVCVWSSVSQSDGLQDVYARFFDEDLEPVTGEFLVNQTTDGTQILGDVFGDSEGGFVATWTSDDSGIFHTYFRVFDEFGSPLTSEVRIDSDDNQEVNQSVVLSLPGDQILAAWYGGYARLFDQSGNPIGNVFEVDQTNVSVNKRAVRLAVYPTGDFVVVWYGGAAGGTGNGEEHEVFAQWFKADGTPKSDAVMVNQEWEGEQWNPDVAVNSDGLTIVTWQVGKMQFQQELVEDMFIKASWWDENGDRLSGDWRANEIDMQVQSPYVALDETGVALIGWSIREWSNPSYSRARAKAFQWTPDEPGDDDADDDETDDDSANADEDDDDDDDAGGCGC